MTGGGSFSSQGHLVVEVWTKTEKKGGKTEYSFPLLSNNIACVMSDLYNSASTGYLARVKLLVEQGTDINQEGRLRRDTALCRAAGNNHLAVVRYLVDQGADMDIADCNGSNPLLYACTYGHLEVVRFLLEQGANRDKASNYGITPLHEASRRGHIEIAKLLMVYGADLNAKTGHGSLPIDLAEGNEEMRQAIRDEPCRRMDEAPGKRCVEEDRHPNAANKPQVDEEDSSKQPTEERKIADEDQDSEPSSDEDDD